MLWFPMVQQVERKYVYTWKDLLDVKVDVEIELDNDC